MIEVRSKLRKWGNSFGVVLPQKSLGGLNEGMDITIFIEPVKTDVSKLVGRQKIRKSTEKIMREIDSDLDDG